MSQVTAQAFDSLPVSTPRGELGVVLEAELVAELGPFHRLLEQVALVGGTAAADWEVLELRVCPAAGGSIVENLFGPVLGELFFGGPMRIHLRPNDVLVIRVRTRDGKPRHFAAEFDFGERKNSKARRALERLGYRPGNSGGGAGVS